MQREDKIPFDSIGKIIDAIYQGNPTVFEAYSDFERDIGYFPTKKSLTDFISKELTSSNKHKSVYCLMQYPEWGGVVRKRKILLDPKRCDGATYRYTMEGWGLIQFQMNLTDPELVSCRFAVNSEKRANNWASVAPELGAPSLWNWSLIEKNIRRLIRVLRKNAKAV